MSDIDDLLMRDYDDWDDDGPTREYSTCPICDGPLVERVNSKTRQTFMGCKDYPRCRGSVALVLYAPKAPA